MIREQYQIGDRVVMQMDREARSWGRKGAPDGTVGIIEGRNRYEQYRGYEDIRYSYEPGLYAANGALIVRWIELPEGSVLSDYIEQLGSDCLRLQDSDEQKRREEEYRNMTLEERDALRAKVVDEKKIGELPEAMYLTGDEILMLEDGESDREHYRYHISSIKYNFRFNDGTVEHLYDISISVRDTGQSAGSTARLAKDIELVQRGNVWRKVHNEPLLFTDINEEASFARSMGQTEEMRNPSDGLYRWTKDEVLNAIRNGIVDGFVLSSAFFSAEKFISAMRFKDRDLGERVRRATLDGFEVA